MVEKNSVKTGSGVITPDDIMLNTWMSLLKDFRVTSNEEALFERQKIALLEGVPSFRSVAWPNKFEGPEKLFKIQYQLENFFKRYIFKSDKYTQEELSFKGIKDFIDYQTIIGKPVRGSQLTHEVLQTARCIIKDILGPYDPLVHESYCAFGRRAARLVPYRDSYLDVKMSQPYLSSSPELWEWFLRMLSRDTILEHAIHSVQTGFLLTECQPINSLRIACAPKTFKAARTICPNSVVGSFYTYGLGSYMQDRLSNCGLHIPTLQQRHGELVKEASITRKLVTADLSKASDGPRSEMMNKCFPRPWYCAMKLARVKSVTHYVKTWDCKRRDWYFKTVVNQLQTFMVMGVGYTFTAQMLLFYGILKAISRLSGIKGLISVYGDDLIYPRAMHKYVVSIFPKLGITLNKDKTFVESNFRESCGYDYYHGKDVRPCQPEHNWEDEMDDLGLISFCYKLHNGLTKRWNSSDIPSTLYYLKRIIASKLGFIHQVPDSHPDTSGIRTAAPQLHQADKPWLEVQENPHLQCPSFLFLKVVNLKRPVSNVGIFYWEALRSSCRPIDEHPWLNVADSPILSWIKDPNGLNPKTGKRRTLPLLPAVNDKTMQVTLVTRGSSSRWTEGTLGSNT